MTGGNGGKQYTARYEGGDKVRFTEAGGKSFEVKVGQEKVEAMYLDELAFGSLVGELKVSLQGHFNPFSDIGRDLPF